MAAQLDQGSSAHGEARGLRQYCARRYSYSDREFEGVVCGARRWSRIENRGGALLVPDPAGCFAGESGFRQPAAACAGRAQSGAFNAVVSAMTESANQPTTNSERERAFNVE